VLLPKQSPPVERTKETESKDRKNGITPQIVCRCRNNQLWCLVGKNFYNTGQKC
jgi:hypothetical protein